MRKKLLSILVLLCLTVSGAWAGAEPPLITILSADNTDFTSGSKTFDDKVTVTFSGNVSYYSEYGWFSAQERTLTVTAAEGYTITGVRFTNNSGSGFVFEAPFEAILGYENDEYFAKVNGSSIGDGDGGVTKIEVYGYADTPEPTTYTVTMKGGTLDATSWQGKAGEGNYQALPLEGVAAGTAVTVKYDGRKKVKSVTIEKADPLAVPLTMEALTDGNIVVDIMNMSVGARRYDDPESSKRVPGRRGSSNISMKYSLNGGAKTPVTSDAIAVSAGDKVQFYGNGPDMSNYCVPNIAGGTAQVKVYGNIMSMLDEDNYATLTTLPNFAFYGLFGGNANLTDASGLLLPATTLAGVWCYFGMFMGCTSLTTAPALPATTLTEYCYYGMFASCTSLTTAPALPATELAGGCYNYMFNGCTSLTTAPTLPATTLTNGCYSSMFSGCTSLTTAPVLPAETLADYCYASMFDGCTSLTTAPALPATTLTDGCYSEMFSGCTSLSSITCLATEGINENYSTSYWLQGVASTGTFITPASTNWTTNSPSGIPTGWMRVDPNAFVPLTMEALTDGTIVVSNPKSGMQYSLNGGAKTPVTSDAINVTTGDKVAFYGNGTSITSYFGTIIAGGTASVKAYGNIMSLLDETGYATLTTLLNQDYVFYTLFYGNTNLTDASGLLLPATTLAEGCYYNMFKGCTSLTTAPTLPATTLANYCYTEMFKGCTSLTTAPTLPATTLANYCYSNMFEGCTSLVTAPALPATTLPQFCYQLMFSGCTSLTTAPELPATTLANYCYNVMFAGCTSLTTAPALPAETLAEGCYYGMFQGCTNLNSVTCMATDISASYCTTGWLDGVATSGTFITPSTTNWTTNSPDGIPTGWTRVDPNAFVPLTLEALTDGTIEVYIVDPAGARRRVSPGSSKRVPGGGESSNFSRKYSVNNGEKTLIPMGITTINVNAGDKVQFYGNGTIAQVYGGDTFMALQGTAQTKVYGNIMSLVDETGYATLTTLQDHPGAFMATFYMNTNLTDASGLLLPATTLSNHCYGSMFNGCTSLTAAPVLPATELAEGCYSGMFQDCESLTTAPTLPVETLASDCYSYMFYGCTSLTTAPALPATELADYCYSSMFESCTSLTTAPALPATTLASSCYNGMFNGCTSLTTAPELPAPTLTEHCYDAMFQGCTSLVTAPALPAETLASDCYRSMFKNCTSLTTAPALPATTLANYCYRSMFSGCTSLTTAPVLPATTLANSCYNFMFSGCTSLNSVTCMATDISASNCINSWLQNVASTGTFTKASGATWPEGASGIPSGWTVNEQ